jgi:sugar/nucleoside kinase (ribokinase family)
MRVPLVLPSSDRPFDVVTLGENSLDLVAVVGGGLVAGKQRLRDFRLEPGGQMATAALGCARLGLRTRYVGAFGDDEWSQRAREPLDAAGVDVVAVDHRGVPGRVAIILVDAAGDRTVLERRDVGLDVPAEALTPARLATARVLLADATQPAATQRALRLARDAGTISVCDVDTVSDEAEDILTAVDVVVVPAPFVAAWSGTPDLRAGLTRLAAHCRQAVVVVATCGPEGSVALCSGEFMSTQGLAVDVVDTTGAGDAFRAGLVAALVHLGPEADLTDVLRFANVTGALNCRHVGAQRGLPTLVEVRAHVTTGSAGLSK